MVTATLPGTKSSSLDENLQLFIFIHPSTSVGDAAQKLRVSPANYAIIANSNVVESDFSPLTLVSQAHLDALHKSFGESRLDAVINRLPPVFVVYNSVEMGQRDLEWYGRVMSTTAMPGLIIFDETISQILGILPIEVIFERWGRDFDKYEFNKYADHLVTNVGLAKVRYKYLAHDIYKQLAADIPMCVFVCDYHDPRLMKRTPDCNNPPSCDTHGLMHRI
jgi:hypothetical protein